MSNNSNDPQPEITIEELITPTISVNRQDGIIYVFFGKTPRAQLQIRMQNAYDANPRELNEIKKQFRLATVSFQR